MTCISFIGMFQLWGLEKNIRSIGHRSAHGISIESSLSLGTRMLSGPVELELMRTACEPPRNGAAHVLRSNVYARSGNHPF